MDYLALRHLLSCSANHQLFMALEEVVVVRSKLLQISFLELAFSLLQAAKAQPVVEEVELEASYWFTS